VNQAPADSEKNRFRGVGGRGTMTATETQPVDVPQDDWRGRVQGQPGRAAHRRERADAAAKRGRCFVSLLWPYRLTVALACARGHSGKTLPALSVPLLVQRGIDEGIPPILSGGPARTLMVDRRGSVRRGGNPGHQSECSSCSAPAGSVRRCCARLRRRVCTGISSGSTSRSTSGTPRGGW